MHPRRRAERLGEDFDFVRMELYPIGQRLVVGELTHYPHAGNELFDPPEWDATLGALWPVRPSSSSPVRGRRQGHIMPS